MVSTHLKNISHIASSPQVGVKIKKPFKPPPRKVSTFSLYLSGFSNWTIFTIYLLNPLILQVHSTKISKTLINNRLKHDIIHINSWYFTQKIIGFIGISAVRFFVATIFFSFPQLQVQSSSWRLRSNRSSGRSNPPKKCPFFNAGKLPNLSFRNENHRNFPYKRDLEI